MPFEDNVVYMGSYPVTTLLCLSNGLILARNFL